MDLYLIVLRALHIFAGVFWVGAALMFFFFVEPTTKKLGPQAGPVETLQRDEHRRRIRRQFGSRAANDVVGPVAGAAPAELGQERPRE